MQRGSSWEDRRPELYDLFIACVGRNYGPRPEEKIDEIRKTRGAYGWKIIEYLALNKNDIVLDMGSGCGFIAGVVAPSVKQIHCADLNEDFLAFCREELRDRSNAFVHRISYANFDSLSSLGINKIYSTAVWIHFNFYDMIANLKAINRLLSEGGTIYFDFAEPAGIKHGDERIFREHFTSYCANRSNYEVLVKFNSSEAVRAALEMCGFECEKTWQVWGQCFGVLAKKVADPKF